MSQELVLVGDPAALPQRKAAATPDSTNARLLRTLVQLAPADLPAVSAIGFEVALAAMADATKLAIAADLDCFVRWCAKERCPPLPASSEDLVRYLRWLGEVGRKPSTQARRISSIARAYRLLGLGESDLLTTQARMVHDALKAGRRRQGVSQRQAAPLRFGGALGDGRAKGTFTIEVMLAACGGDFQGLRDAALLSTGYDGGLRVSELVAARVEHLEPEGDGSGILALPASKTDQEGEGAYVWLSPDTMRRIHAWLEVTGIEDGPLFRRVGVDRRRAREAVPPLPYHAIPGQTRHWQEKLKGMPATPAQVIYTIGEQPLTRQGVTAIYRRVATGAFDAGLVDLPVAKVDVAIRALSTHSLRVGLTQDLFAAGEDGSGIALALRWKSPTTALRYGRKLAAGNNAAARLLAKVRV